MLPAAGVPASGRARRIARHCRTRRCRRMGAAGMTRLDYGAAVPDFLAACRAAGISKVSVCRAAGFHRYAPLPRLRAPAESPDVPPLKLTPRAISLIWSAPDTTVSGNISPHAAPTATPSISSATTILRAAHSSQSPKPDSPSRATSALPPGPTPASAPSIRANLAHGDRPRRGGRNACPRRARILRTGAYPAGTSIGPVWHDGETMGIPTTSDA